MQEPALSTTAAPPARFELVRELGAGLSGRAFLTRDRTSGGVVVVKRFHVGGPNDAPLEELRAHYERLLALPPHPSLCRVLAFDADENGPYATFEHVRGRPLSKLRARIERHARRVRADAARDSRARDAHRLAKLLDAIDGALAGLELMHGAGVAHGDCRPNNVLWSHGRLVLIDYDRLLNAGVLEANDFRAARMDDLDELGTTLAELARAISPVETLDGSPQGIPIAYGRGGRVEFRAAELACVLHELVNAARAREAAPRYSAAREARSGGAAASRALRGAVARRVLEQLPPRPRWTHPVPVAALLAAVLAAAAITARAPEPAQLLACAAALALTLWCVLGSQRTRERRGALLAEALRRHRRLRANASVRSLR
jgi:hypothetical protein